MKTWVSEFDVFGYFDSWAVYQLFSYIRYEWGNVNYQDYQTYQKCECPWVVTGTWFNCCLEGDSCNRGDRVDAANGNMAFMAHVSIKVRQLTAWECLFNTLILAVTNSSDLTTNALPCFPIGVLPHCAAFSLLDWLDFGWLVHSFSRQVKKRVVSSVAHSAGTWLALFRLMIATKAVTGYGCLLDDFYSLENCLLPEPYLRKPDTVVVSLLWRYLVETFFYIQIALLVSFLRFLCRNLHAFLGNLKVPYIQALSCPLGWVPTARPY